jgi:hypothetical protein
MTIERRVWIKIGGTKIGVISFFHGFEGRGNYREVVKISL